MINIFLLQTSSSLKLVHLNMYRISDINEMTTGWIVSDYWKKPPATSANKIDRHDITEILLKVTLNTLTLTLLNDTRFNQITNDLVYIYY
jgi:hypothetical protein